jgi:hypothetical protein
MTTTALVAGPSERAGDVAAALRAEGFATITVDDREPVGAACNRVSPRSVDCFVRLPAEGEREGQSSPGGARPPRAHGLLSMVDAVAAVAPLLADHATVVILAEGSDPAHRRDRLLDDAVGLLAEAVVADHGGDGVRVSVLGPDQSPDDIAAAAARGGVRPHPGPSLADFEPDLAYADWRTQVLSLSGHKEATYFGWSGADGRRPVAIIRGAVISPLRALGAQPDSGSLSWGDSGPGAFLLARALLADVLGSTAGCPGCAGAGEADCPDCNGTGLSEAVERQVTPFVHEIVAPLQGEAFELPAAVVQAWIDRRTEGLGRPIPPGGTVDQGGGMNPRRRRIRRRPRLASDGVDRSPTPIHPSSVL